MIEFSQNITTEDGNECDDEEETEATRIYLGKIYFCQFLESLVPIICGSPSLYIMFIGRVMKFGYKELSKDIIEKFETLEQYQHMKQIPLINDLHQYITLYLEQIGVLISYLSINSTQKPPTKTTMEKISPDNNTKNKNKPRPQVRYNLKMNDAAIIAEAKGILLHLIEFIEFCDDDEVIECLQSVLPSKGMFRCSTTFRSVYRNLFSFGTLFEASDML